MVGRVIALENALAMVAVAVILALSGCDSHSSGSQSASAKANVSEQAWLQYRSDVIETATLITQYVRHWEKTGDWPKPGTYDTRVLVYKGTEPDNAAFSNRRRDFYRSQFDGGRELDIILYDDGRISVDVLWDRESIGPGR